MRGIVESTALAVSRLAARSLNGGLHHRIEHAFQLTDHQLARMVAMDLATVTQFDGPSATGWHNALYHPDTPAELVEKLRAIAESATFGTP